MAVELYPAAHFRPPWICHNRLRPASFVTESGLLAVCGGDFWGWSLDWSSPPVDTCEVLDTDTQQWREDYRVPSVPQNISCQLFPGQSDCDSPNRVDWTDSVTLPGIGVFLFGNGVTLSVLLRTGSTSWVPTPGWIEPHQLRMADPPRGWSCIVALPKTNSILVIPDGRARQVREFRASSGSGPGLWAPDESWPSFPSLDDIGCSVVSNKLIIAGGRGRWEWGSDNASTVIIDLEKKTIKYAGDLNYPRFGHVMTTLNGAVYAFGGQAWFGHRPLGNPHGGGLIDTVEVWDMNMETWEVLDVKMARGRTYMAALVVDPKKFFLPFASGSGSGSGDEYGKGFGTGNDYS